MSPQKSVRKQIVVGLFTVALLGGSVALFVERTPLLAWFYMHSLSRAVEKDRALWVDRTAGLGEGAEPTVFACLTQTDEGACRIWWATGVREPKTQAVVGNNSILLQ